MEILRNNKNPLITKDRLSFRANSIFNAGATKYNDEYILLCRVELPIGRSTFSLATSKNGIDFILSDKPVLTPEDHTEYSEYVSWGIEDARITKIENRYLLTYTGYSKYNPVVILSETTNFKDFKIHGPISEASNKDCAIFPEKINGYYWKVDRPEADNRRDIWIGKSPDLIHWGDYSVLMEPSQGTWEANKIGGSTPPIKTKEGWLMLYHGVRGFGISSLYKLGVVLLDLENPRKVIGKSVNPILTPQEDYERTGDVGNVVFANGWIEEENGDVKIYYSGADMNICLAETTIDYLLSLCL